MDAGRHGSARADNHRRSRFDRLGCCDHLGRRIDHVGHARGLLIRLVAGGLVNSGSASAGVARRTASAANREMRRAWFFQLSFMGRRIWMVVFDPRRGLARTLGQGRRLPICGAMMIGGLNGCGSLIVAGTSAPALNKLGRLRGVWSPESVSE